MSHETKKFDQPMSDYEKWITRPEAIRRFERAQWELAIATDRQKLGPSPARKELIKTAKREFKAAQKALEEVYTYAE